MYLAITTDVVYQHVFDKDLKLTGDKQRAHDWKKTIYSVAFLTPLAKQFTWILPLALKLPVFLLQATMPSQGRLVELYRVRRGHSLKFSVHYLTSFTDYAEGM